MGMLVHSEQQANIAFPQDVAQDGFVLPLLEVVVEQGLCLLILEQVERNGRKPLGVDEYVGLSISMFQLLGGLNHFLEIGRHGVRNIDRIFRIKEIIVR